MTAEPTTAPVLTSRRIALKPYAATDAPDLVALHRDQRVTALLIDGIPDEPWKAEVYLGWATDLHARGIGPWTARRRDDGRFLGLFTLTPYGAEDDGLLEFGGRLARAGWPGGLSIEAGAAVLDHAFGPLRCRAVVSAHHPDNRAAAAALSRLGFGQAVAGTVFGRDAVVHRLDSADWTARACPTAAR